MRAVALCLACCAAIWLLGWPQVAGSPAEHRFTWQRRLAEANNFYDAGEWLVALERYRSVRAVHADLAMDDEICFRIARCSEMGLSTLSKLMPAGIGADWWYGRKMMRWLRDTYGYYVEESEGDGWWVYDKRALRELLRLHPRSRYADDAEYVLIKYQLAYQWGPPIEIQRAWPEAVKRYERLLERYPDSDLRGIILEEIAFLRNPSGLHSQRVRQYWHSTGFEYPSP